MKKIVLLSLALLLVGLSPAQTPPPKIELKALPKVTVSVLVENMAGSAPTLDAPVLGEWGLSLFIDTDQHRILLDTGAGNVLINNARAMGIDLAKTEALVISHEHFDHTGGLEKLLQAAGPMDLFVSPEAFGAKYFKAGPRAVKHVMPLSPEQLRVRVRKLVETREPTLICDGVMVTGQIPRVIDFEDTGLVGRAFLDEECKIPDPILDDQAIFFRVPEGLVILLGCGHAGLVNTIRYVSELLAEPRIYAVIGGTHLIGASPDRLQKTIEALKKYDVQKIMLAHCTGVQSYVELAKALPGRCFWPATGSRIRFGK